MFGIKKRIDKLIFKCRWIKNNGHNYTTVNSVFGLNQVTVGKKTYGELNVNLGTNPERKIQIGNFCSIAPGVTFIINPHNYHFFSTWGWQIFEYDERNYDWEQKKEIIIEDDVWIGQGATILGGAILRQGCVIGAGAIVSGEVPPYAIFAGGKVIKMRFCQEICNKLIGIDYSKIDKVTIAKIRGWHKIEINEDNVDHLLTSLPLKEGEVSK